MSDSILNKITSAAQVSGYKTATHDGGNNGTRQIDYINIPMGAIVTDVCAVVTTAFAGGATTLAAGWGGGLDQTDLTGATARAADEDAYLDCAVASFALTLKGTKICASANTTIAVAAGTANPIQPAGLFIGTMPSYTLSSSFGSNGEEKVAPVTLSQVQSGSAVSTAGTLLWWVEYMFPANIVWTQTSL